MFYSAMFALGATLALPLVAMACAFGQGRAAAAALESIGRNPEAARDIQTNLIIALAMIESLAIYALLVFVILQGRLAPVAEVLKQMGQ
jgi:F-type H+-transporting ATPase subunit c